VSITVSPPSFAFQLHAAQQQQIDPQHAHEMPVHRRVLKQTAAKHGMAGHQPAGKIDKRENAGGHMQHMQEGEQIEKRTVRVGRQVNSPGAELEPGTVLSHTESQA
jgi:hypothetical protein